MRFEWDDLKAQGNLRRHGLTFNEASTAFEDPHAVVGMDEKHCQREMRQWILGLSQRNRVVLVVFVERAPKTYRIITAREATADEYELYEEEKNWRIS